MTDPYCQDCEHSHADNEKLPSRLWLCTRFRRRINSSHVVRGEWARDEHYIRCAVIAEHFICPLFEPKEERDGQ